MAAAQVREHRFWSTQPVRQFGGGGAALEEDGAIDAPKTVEDVRKTPLKLPPAFEWSTCDVNDSEVLKVRTERHCWDRVRRTACSPAAPSIHLRVYTSQCWDDEGWGLTGHIPSHMTRPGAARHRAVPAAHLSYCCLHRPLTRHLGAMAVASACCIASYRAGGVHVAEPQLRRGRRLHVPLRLSRRLPALGAAAAGLLPGVARWRARLTAVPATVRVSGRDIKMAEVNFLCVHKKLRAKRLAPVLIQEITRRVNLEGIWQAVYTAGVVLPKPVASCRYYHRSINPKKLIEVGFSRLAPRMTMARTIKLFKLPDEPEIPGIRPMTEEDIPSACKLLDNYLKK